MAEGCGGSAKKHHAKTREQQIDVGWKRSLGSIAVAKGQVCTMRPRAARTRNLKHRPRYVDAEDCSCGADNSRKFDRGIAATATDVDHPLSWLRCCSLQRGV